MCHVQPEDNKEDTSRITTFYGSLYALFCFIFRRAAVLTDRLSRAAAWHRAHRQQPHPFSSERCPKGNASGDNVKSSYFLSHFVHRIQIGEAAEWEMWPSCNRVDNTDVLCANPSFESIIFHYIIRMLISLAIKTVLNGNVCIYTTCPVNCAKWLNVCSGRSSCTPMQEGGEEQTSSV